jgi:hypothetical protein
VREDGTVIQIEVFAAVLLALGSFLIIRAVKASDVEEEANHQEQQEIHPRPGYRRAA